MAESLPRPKEITTNALTTLEIGCEPIIQENYVSAEDLKLKPPMNLFKTNRPLKVFVVVLVFFIGIIVVINQQLIRSAISYLTRPNKDNRYV